MSKWSVEDIAEAYGIPNWGADFLKVNEKGNLVIAPSRTPDKWLDVAGLIEHLVRRGIELPLLLRFTDLLQARIDTIAQAFHSAISEYDYKGVYRGVYPIKVNQQRHVVEDIVRFSRPHHMGLEAGSKPELLIVLAMLEDPEALIICNGYKDEEYIATAAMAQKLGRRPIIVIEKMDEVDLCIRVARETGARPILGVRAKLASRGAGRWEASTGDRAKFGLTAGEIVEVVDKLTAADMIDCLQLLHFHIGSQVSAIRSFKNALKEASRIYVELHAMGAPMKYFDVGGGLGVDYDGSRTNFASSVNYTIDEYASDVVWTIQEACDRVEVPHPTVITESGRAMVAHHAVLIFNVLGTTRHPEDVEVVQLDEEDPDVLHDLAEGLKKLSRKTYMELWHDAQAARDEILTMFKLGLIDLRQRARGERLFWQVSRRIQRMVEEEDYVPDDMATLPKTLADIYYCNFSVFQSMPDAWAVGQLFPVVPVQRLTEKPTRQAILADITCDSDGKLDKFIDLRDVRSVLDVHELEPGKPYYFAAFLVGAYQEILGDLHNLFGDTNSVHVTIEGPGRYTLDSVVEGDTVTDVLNYVSYNKKDLIRKVRAATETALQQQKMSMEESRSLLQAYQRGLEGYTYLE